MNERFEVSRFLVRSTHWLIEELVVKDIWAHPTSDHDCHDFAFWSLQNLEDGDPKLLCILVSVLHHPWGENIFPNVQPEALNSQLSIIPFYSDISSLLYLNPHPPKQRRFKRKWNCKSLFTVSCNFLSPISSCACILSSTTILDLNMNLYRLRYIRIKTTLITAVLNRWVLYLQAKKMSYKNIT